MKMFKVDTDAGFVWLNPAQVRFVTPSPLPLRDKCLVSLVGDASVSGYLQTSITVKLHAEEFARQWDAATNATF